MCVCVCVCVRAYVRACVCDEVRTLVFESYFRMFMSQANMHSIHMHGLSKQA